MKYPISKKHARPASSRLVDLSSLMRSLRSTLTIICFNVALAIMIVTYLGSIIATASGCSAASFTQPVGSPFTVSKTTDIGQLTVADFNLDGKPDIAVVQTAANGGAVFLGDGTGGFGAAKPFFGVGDRLVTADFNVDGKPDLAVLNRPNLGTNNITVLLGDGAGNFTTAPGSPFVSPISASLLAVADFNLDGKPDLITASSANPATVTVLLGKGDGSFSPGAPVSIGKFPQAMAVGDFNLDGKTDVVTSSESNTATVLLGNGTGGFIEAPGSPIDLKGFPQGFLIADFNNDGKPDLAVEYAGSVAISPVKIFVGNGNGGFSLFSSINMTGGIYGWVTGDFNLDGNVDIASANMWLNNVTILLGDGLGHMSDPSSSPVYSVEQRPSFIALGDFNSDGRPDFATANSYSRNISVELNGCTAPTIQFSQGAYSVQEDLSAMTVTVTRTGDLSSAASVDYKTINGSATQKSDFEYAAGTLTFAAGEAGKTVTILLNEDAFTEGNETFYVVLNNPVGAGLGTQSTTTITILDDLAEPIVNPIDDAQSFVYTHYHDFLNREPDSAGLVFWTSQITACGTDAQCLEAARVNVSASFFLSIEFQETAYLLYLIRKESYATMPKYSSFMRDLQDVSRGVVVNTAGWQQKLSDNQLHFTNEWVNRTEFKAAYDGLSNDAFVTALYKNAGVVPPQTEKDKLVAALNGAIMDRAAVLMEVATDAAFRQQERNGAFVLMEYFGYLRRDPDAAPDSNLSGYNFWLNKLNEFGGNYVDAEMVKAFITSFEYRQRFAQ